MKSISIIKTYFGQLPGQTLQQFMDEVKGLKAQCETPGAESYDSFLGKVAKEIGVEVTET